MNTPPNPDPYPSLDVNPRNINDAASCKFHDNGVYRAIVKVTDDDGAIGINYTIIIVNIQTPEVIAENESLIEPELPNNPPKATVNAYPKLGTVPLNVSFTGSGYDIDGTIVSFYWDFDDGNTFSKKIFSPSNASYHNLYHTYNNPGIYTIKLTVTDDDNATSFDIVTILVNEKPIHVENIFTISGYVYKANTLKRIAHVNVAINLSSVFTDHTGFYSVIVPAGIYTINVSKSGYEPTSATVIVSSNITLNFYLNPIVTITRKVAKSTDFSWIWILIFIIIILLMIIISFIIKRKKNPSQELLPTVTKLTATTSPNHELAKSPPGTQKSVIKTTLKPTIASSSHLTPSQPEVPTKSTTQVI